MCTDLQAFDLKCQGAFHLAESRRVSPQLNVVWALEDIIRVYNEILPQVIATYEAYCKTGVLPEKLTLEVVLGQLRGFVTHGSSLIQIANNEPARLYGVDGAPDLARYIETARAILRDEDYATDMSFMNFAEN